MACVVGVHGVAHQYRGETTMHAVWFPAMCDGLTRSGARLDAEDLACAFYGDLFRPAERMLGGDPPPDDGALGDVEAALLGLWWAEAARTDPGVVPPIGSQTLGGGLRVVQAALRALTGSRFFALVAERGLIFSLRQVRRYFSEPELRARVRDRLARQISADTRVIVGHSLGSIVAYEALCANPDWPVRTLITLGSPLGTRNLIFERLAVPEPGAWPGSVKAWTNIAADDDVVALVKDLRPLFGERVVNLLVGNGTRAHDVTRYLTAAATGMAIRDGLINA